jgi:hypothetical protein
MQWHTGKQEPRCQMTGLSPPLAGAAGEDASGLQWSSCSAPAHKQEHQVRQAVVRNYSSLGHVTRDLHANRGYTCNMMCRLSVYHSL